MPQSRTVSIVGGAFTSRKRAEMLIAKRVADWADVRESSIKFRELPAARVQAYHSESVIHGSFEWHVRPSAGYSVLQADRILSK